MKCIIEQKIIRKIDIKISVYFETGKLLSEAGKEYVNNEKLNSLGSKLSWSHYSKLLIYLGLKPDTYLNFDILYIVH